MATTTEELIEGLNQDLAHELRAVLAYMQQTSMALGIDIVGLGSGAFSRSNPTHELPGQEGDSNAI